MKSEIFFFLILLSIIAFVGCDGCTSTPIADDPVIVETVPYNGPPFEVFFLDRKSIPPPAHPSQESFPELTFTADVYVIDHAKKKRFGPFEGSTFPDNKQINVKQPRTVLSGRYLFNNKYGHGGASKRGLNLVDSNGDRFTDAQPWTGLPDKAENINVHNGGTGKGHYWSRYSQGCLTIDKDTINEFMSLFKWTIKNTEGNYTRGISSGHIHVVRTSDEEREDYIKEIESIYDQG